MCASFYIDDLQGYEKLLSESGEEEEWEYPYFQQEFFKLFEENSDEKA